MSNNGHFRLQTFISGGIAGCVAKSLVAPIDRVKILRQVHSKHYESYGILESFVRVPEKEGGLRAFYKGNGAQMLRIFPYAALQYGSYETYKSINRQIFASRADFYLSHLVCGSLAGMTAVTLTYPLDVIHSRLAFQFRGKEMYAGISDSIRKIYHVRNIYF